MKYPNKITTYKESVISKVPIILDLIQDHSLTVVELYSKTHRKFDSLAEFVEILDVLFALNKITFQRYNGRIDYVN